MLSDVLAAYDLPEEHCSIQPFGNGLINNTWKIGYLGKSYILQRINQHVFRHPFAIAENIETVGNYLQYLHPSYLFVHPVATAAGQTIIQDKQHGYFRLFPFVEHSHTIDVVKTTTQAYEAAAADEVSGEDVAITDGPVVEDHCIGLLRVVANQGRLVGPFAQE